VQGQFAKMSIDTPRKSWTNLGLRDPQCFPADVKRKIIEGHYAKYVKYPVCVTPNERVRLEQHACKRSKIFYVDCDEKDCVNPDEASLLTYSLHIDMLP